MKKNLRLYESPDAYGLLTDADLEKEVDNYRKRIADERVSQLRKKKHQEKELAASKGYEYWEMPEDYKGPTEAPNYSKEVDGGFFINIYPPYEDPYYEEDSWDDFVVEIQNDDLGIFPDEHTGTYAFFKSFNAADGYANKKVAELRKEFGLAENYKMESLYKSQKQSHIGDPRTKHESYKSRRRFVEAIEERELFEDRASNLLYNLFDDMGVDPVSASQFSRFDEVTAWIADVVMQLKD